MSIVAGIDYSMTSPAMCIHKGSDWSISNCTFYYFTTKPKFILETSQFRGVLYPEYSSQQQRFDNLSEWAIKLLDQSQVKEVGLEGYSYGSSSSRLFEIGENTGLLKYKLWSRKMNFEIYAPTAIKKFASGKGNSNKEKMWDAFFEQTNLNIFNLLGQELGKQWNPVSDMVDAYFIAKYKFENKKVDNLV